MQPSDDVKDVVTIGGNRYMSVKAISEAFGLSTRTVIRRLKENDIPSFRFGADSRSVRYRESDVDAMIEEVERERDR